MKKVHRWQRILILAMLSVSVFAPIVIVSRRLKIISSIGRKEFIEDLSLKVRSEASKLHAFEQEAGEGLKEPKPVVYEDKEFVSGVNRSSSNKNQESKESENGQNTNNFLERNGSGRKSREVELKNRQKEMLSTSGKKKQSNQTTVRHDQNARSQSQRETNEKVKTMKDQLIRAKAYLNFAPPGSNSHLVKELKLRVKEVERAVGEATKDSDLSKRAFQKMRAMEASLSKASHVFHDCSAMATKLRAMTYNAEEQIRAQKNHATYLLQLAARTTPKGLHCLSMRLTAEYFSSPPEERQLPNQQKLHDPDLYHYAVFTDNVLACAVVVNSTVSTAMKPEKVVFHVVTDSLNVPAMSMWFLSNPPGNATVQIQGLENFNGLSNVYNSKLQQQSSHDLRYTSPLNHLRFYLPDIFPALNKIVLFDHDVVVQRDLSGIWSVNMKGKVIGAVETCKEGEPSFRQMDMLINFSDPLVAKRFDVKACTWAFGMNLFDLREWRRQNLTAVYHKYLHLGHKRPLLKAGSLPLGWLTFYNQTVALDRRWHTLGLGYESGVGRSDIERAAVIHYDGVMKPWLDIGIAKYKHYWSRHVLYDQPYLQQCNIHE